MTEYYAMRADYTRKNAPASAFARYGDAHLDMYKAAAEKRMAVIDALPAEVRADIHEHGYLAKPVYEGARFKTVKKKLALLREARARVRYARAVRV